MNFDINRLKQIPILDIAYRIGINVRRNQAMCFNGHDRKTPSLSFSPSKNLWHCFGCGAGGNNINLIKEYYGYDSKGAIAWLSKEFNMTPSYYYGGKSVSTRTVRVENDQLADVKVSFEPDAEIYEDFFSRLSLSPQGKEYLRKRGFTEEIIEKFNIKDLLNSKNEECCLLKNFNKTKLLKSGLMVERYGKIRLIWWDHTILFPFNKENKIIYIQGRRILSGQPKYMGLRGVVKPLYNYDILTQLSVGSTICICEGVTDTLTASQIGLNAVGVLGALSFRKEWCDILNKFRIVIIPDADSAGEKFEQKIREAFLEKGHVVEAFKLPKGSDLTDLLKAQKNGPIK